ncbi:phosphonopyruvate decarboxylase [Plantactinospora solaniradicis]|uniref:Phosphonopyruvate decarboxylase n=1 Tax=Plantactinospora solaniradicis TaxID=1723736 RepID=A0ABW1K2F1_9ACTN
MIRAEELMAALVDHSVTMVTGVPCSFLTPVINRAISDPRVRYLAATQEGEAAAIAAGAWLGGGLGCVISQNSGLGNMVNPLTSLLHPASIPALLLVTWRGEPGRPDEPQHALMGRITPGLLDLMEVPHATLPADPDGLSDAFAVATGELLRAERPYAFVIPKGTVAAEPLCESALPRRTGRVVRHLPEGPAPSRWAALECLLSELPESAAVVSTTGMTSRELYEIADREQHFYLVGAMGSAGAVGLGVAAHTTRPVVVVDGDGALLMRLGGLATIGAYGGDNLVHVVLDNGVHDSTGGQRTLSSTVDLVAAAASCGYRQLHDCTRPEAFRVALGAALAGPGPSLVRLRTRPGSRSGLGRPAVTPAEVARRFRRFVTTAPAGDRVGADEVLGVGA